MFIVYPLVSESNKDKFIFRIHGGVRTIQKHHIYFLGLRRSMSNSKFLIFCKKRDSIVSLFITLQRPLWRHYYQNTEAIILVVDSNDRDRISECRDELWRLLQEEQLKEAVILILANKKDLPNAMKESEVAEKLELQNIKDRTIRK